MSGTRQIYILSNTIASLDNPYVYCFIFIFRNRCSSSILASYYFRCSFYTFASLSSDYFFKLYIFNGKGVTKIFNFFFKNVFNKKLLLSRVLLESKPSKVNAIHLKIFSLVKTKSSIFDTIFLREQNHKAEHTTCMKCRKWD